MNRMLVSFACLFAAGCSTLPTASLYPLSPDSSEFKLISAKVIGDKCIAGFGRDGLLFFISGSSGGSRSSSSSSFDLNVYDARTGLVSSHSIRVNRSRTCSEARFAYTTKVYGDDLRYVSDISLRKNLDQYHLQPEGVWHALSSFGARYGGSLKWHRSDQTTFLEKGPRSTGTIASVVSLLKNLSDDEAMVLVKSQLELRQKRKDDWERKDSAHRAVRAAQMRAEQEAKAQWTHRMSYRLAVGDRVCTYATNSVGDVEALANDRVKVHVFGRAASDVPPGLLFSGAVNMGADLERTEFPRWFNRDELAKCAWGESK